MVAVRNWLYINMQGILLGLAGFGLVILAGILAVSSRWLPQHLVACTMIVWVGLSVSYAAWYSREHGRRILQLSRPFGPRTPLEKSISWGGGSKESRSWTGR